MILAKVQKQFMIEYRQRGSKKWYRTEGVGSAQRAQERVAYYQKSDREDCVWRAVEEVRSTVIVTRTLPKLGKRS
jgi:hypothetical protein